MGVPFMTVYNVYAAVLRGMGDSKMSFYAVLVSAVTNVFLDILFVAVFFWGAPGAALASVISQVMMAVFMIYYARKRHEILRVESKRLFDRTLFIRGCSLSIPITIQSVIASFGGLILQNFMNGFGSVTVAAITTAYRIDTLLLLPVINLGTGIAVITSQNIEFINFLLDSDLEFEVWTVYENGKVRKLSREKAIWAYREAGLELR